MATSTLEEEPEMLETPFEKREDEEDDDNDGKDDDSSSQSSSSDSDSEPGDFENEDEEQAIKRGLKKKFDSFLKQLEGKKLDLGSSAKVDDFLADNNNIIRRRTGHKEQNFLHMLAEYDKEYLPVKRIKGLVQSLTRLPDANLLAERDVDGKTPLFCAVSLRNHRLVKAMCEAHSDIDSVLRIPKGPNRPKGSNCLHQAILNKSSTKDDELAEYLIALSGPETLCGLDENGLTPLHLAVDYTRCDEAQPRIVRALVERCDKALDISVPHKDKGRLSPYRWHDHTYQQAIERRAVEARKKASKMNGEPNDRGSDAGGQRPSKHPVRDVVPVRPQVITDIPLLPQALRKTATFGDTPTGKFGSGVTRKATNDAVSRKRAEIAEVDGLGSRVRPSTPVAEKKKPATATKKSRNSKIQPDEASAAEIKKYLKLYYLRKRRHDDAVEFLYGVQQDRQIYFDLVGSDSKLSESRIADTWHHLVFEDILQYVAIPQVRIEPNTVSTDLAKRQPPKPDGSGRTDLRILFRWLKESRGVKTVLKVIVDDLQDPAHSDEAIESCLTGMGVETWDWRKADLCSEVIHRVSPEASVVHLYWSGNNAVLRGWSDVDGLKKLKKLQTVYLHVQQGLETRTRTKEYVSAFKKRLEADSTIKVIERKQRNGGQDGGPGQLDTVRDPYERHKWIATMEEFAEFLQNAIRHAEPKLALKPPLVAVIDDGVNINDPTLQSKIAGGRSFCHRDEQENLNQPYYVSGGGHGTAMAGLIGKICPSVRLYILKLDEYYIEPGRRQITAKSAAKAVRAAIDRKVDIISMSWTIEKTETNKSDIEELERAIDLAASKNILMFCAATDQGAYRDRSYPAATGTKRIFKIGAAEASGAALKWLGDQSAVDFILPGHQVVLERHGDPRVKQYTALTGSSVATALASGLAAVVLYCVQVGGQVRAQAQAQAQAQSRELGQLLPPDVTDYQKLREHERMHMAFRQIGTTKESENKYITVWNRFSKVVKKAEGELKDVHVELVAGLARDLIRED